MYIHVRRIAGLLSALFVFTSCASIQTRDGNDAALIVRALSTGRADLLAGMSSLPFLVDQEIVSLQADVDSFWKTMAGSGFRVDASGPLSVPVSESSYREFADTMEVRTFFAKYVVKGTRILELSSSGKRVLLLVHEEPFGRMLIQGFKGPF
jgi:hypothetical protein